MSKRWKPEKGEAYWYFNLRFQPIYDIWSNTDSDEFFYSTYNCFQTRVEVLVAVERIKAFMMSLHEEAFFNSVSKKVQLPDWCKVGEWAYFDNQYSRIEKIDTEICVSPVIDFSNGARKTYGSLCWDDVKQTHLRPYTDTELEGLVGKVVKTKEGASYLVNAFNPALKDTKACVSVDTWASADLLLKDGYTIDGKPCGVFAHLNEKGEWVE